MVRLEYNQLITVAAFTLALTTEMCKEILQSYTRKNGKDRVQLCPVTAASQQRAQRSRLYLFAVLFKKKKKSSTWSVWDATKVSSSKLFH